MSDRVRIRVNRTSVAIITICDVEVTIYSVPNEVHGQIRAGKVDPIPFYVRAQDFANELATLLDKYEMPRYAVEVLT